MHFWLAYWSVVCVLSLAIHQHSPLSALITRRSFRKLLLSPISCDLCQFPQCNTATSTSHTSDLPLSVLLKLLCAILPHSQWCVQAGQDKKVDTILHGLSGGFFVESGAYNGVDLSNSLYFEAARGWDGLLIEANPHLFQDIVHRSGRNASVIHACLSPSTRPQVLPFKLAGPLGGISQHLSAQHTDRINREIGEKQSWMHGQAGSGADVSVSCWPLAAMLNVLGVTRVDFWSLDTEGSEAAILAATDFDMLDIRVITIEVNDAAAEAAVKKVMAGRPEYRLHSKLDFDLLFVKEGA